LLNDFEIITRHFPENKDIKIYPISDVHLGAGEHMAPEWDNFCKKILEELKEDDRLIAELRSSVQIYQELLQEEPLKTN
jgi:DNA polymerase II small subunit/DNA polymerase delta subunit B